MTATIAAIAVDEATVADANSVVPAFLAASLPEPLSTAWTAPPPTTKPRRPALLPSPSFSPANPSRSTARAGKSPQPQPPRPLPNITSSSLPPLTIPSGWDGGATLPGESLSRHRRPDARAEHRQEARADYRNPAPTLPRAQIIHEADGVSVAETIEEQPEVLLATHPELISPDQLPIEPVATSAEPVVASAEPVAAVEPVAAPAEPVEYEPTEASVSYRVDPIAPSEYRQSAPTLEAPEEVQPEPHSAIHTITPGPGETIAPLHTDSEPIHETASAGYEKFDWQTSSTPAIEAAPAPHQLTTLHATGEMHSETPEATFTPEHAAEAVAPIEHETAVSNPAENALASAAPHFAPGVGALEEESLDDEDFTTTLHASSIEEYDDLDEEETLEGAADLGTMLREMSIDQITRSGVDQDQDEEDDLEEEDTIHDPLLDEDESDTEEDDEDLDESDTEEDVLHEEDTEGEASPNGFDQAQAGASAPSQDPSRDLERRSSRRDSGRRDGRGRSDRYGRGDRPRNTGGSGDRERSGGGRDRRGGRSSMQSTNLPAISELLKPGQEILVQIAKEPIARKGARITSHIALPGRFLVFMPTVNHTGVSRKIESDGERRRLKEILLSEKGEAAGGFIVRTAASGASEEELRSDLRFLLNLWADIKQRSESSKSPALIYHDLNLVERILRDQVTDNFSAIWVDTETDYERILRFLQRFQPSLIRRVKLYSKETPLFEQFGITEEINKALRSKVWLKSGGSIVINQTEALVAIDINTGKFVGKTARLEDTIVKTNLDAIPEIVRQIRLRDLGGIIIIDFIDMDERKNRNKVMAALEEELKSDRAPSKVLQFNDFGLVAITRKRVKQSLERTLSTTCNVCVGTGMVKSPVTVCNDIYIEMRKMQKHLDRGDVMLRVHPDVVKQLKAPGTKWLQEMEEMVGKTILVKSDPSLHPEQFDVH